MTTATAKLDRLCLECGSKITGRSDKKFCDDGCRTAHHNHSLVGKKDIVKETDRILHENYKILKKLNTRGKTKVTFSELKQQKLNFFFFTSSYSGAKGTYFYCYDQGYLMIEPGLYLLVKRL